MTATTISTPCVGICRMEWLAPRCRGCKRTREEIAGWLAMDESERLRIMAQLPDRR